MPPTTDYTTMPLGTVLQRWKGGQQAIERCPICGRPGKPRCAPQGRQYVHTATVVRGPLVAYTATTQACMVPQQ